jgi:SpoVK/Ycf46/Vps4 family AAA+-type ATPase
MLRSLKPVVVFMDEIDQSEGQRGGQGDAGVSRRIFSKLLQFMSDPDLEGEVIWIGASNRADQIDAAMKRAGRFDLIIPFLLPDEPTRKDIFIKKFQEREVELQLAEKDWAQVVRLSHSFTGAEIEALVKEAVWRALAGAGVFDVDGKPKSVRIALKDMLKAFEVYRPTANREEYDRQTELTISEVTCIDLLPLEYQKKRDELDKRLGRILTNT